MRLPPSSTAWRMPSARRGSGALARASAASSAASVRRRQASSRGPVPPAPGASVIPAQLRERLGLVGFLRIAQPLYPQFGLLQRLRAAPVQAHAALVRSQRLLQAQLAAFHVIDKRLELFQRLLEIGDGGGVRGLFFYHATSLSLWLSRYAKRPARGVLRIWRRGGDSNPRGAINACLLSSQVH